MAYHSHTTQHPSTGQAFATKQLRYRKNDARDETMADEELLAARSLADIQCPSENHDFFTQYDSPNCIQDGQCADARTEDCTDACHPCEEPHECSGGQYCDPRNICWNPDCNGEDLDSMCHPCEQRMNTAHNTKNQLFEGGNPAQTVDDFGMLFLADNEQAIQAYPTPSSSHSAQPSTPGNVSRPECISHSHSFLEQPSDNAGNTLFPWECPFGHFHYGPQYPTSAMESMNLPPNTPVSQTYPLIKDEFEFGYSVHQPYPSQTDPSTPSEMTRSSSQQSFVYGPDRHQYEPCSSRLSSNTHPLIPKCQWQNGMGTCPFIGLNEKDLHDHIMTAHIEPMSGRGRSKNEKHPMICCWAGCAQAESQKTWTALQHIKDHMVVHSCLREECPQCGKKVRDKKSLKSHLAVCGKEDAQTKHVCPECNAVLKSASTLKQHMNIHKGKLFECDICGHTTHDQSNLRKHKRTHNKEDRGNYRCACCNKPFGSRYNMERHEKTVMKKRQEEAAQA